MAVRQRGVGGDGHRERSQLVFFMELFSAFPSETTILYIRKSRFIFKAF